MSRSIPMQEYLSRHDQEMLAIDMTALGWSRWSETGVKTISVPGKGPVVEIVGPLSARPGWGEVSFSDIREALALGPSLVRIESPGGTLLGWDELLQAAVVAGSAGVRVESTQHCCSLAYWLAAALGHKGGFHTLPSTLVGSVGVKLARLDAHEALKREGLAWNIFESGYAKSWGDPRKPLSEAEAAEHQASVTRSYEQFRESIVKFGFGSAELWDRFAGRTVEAKTEVGLVTGFIRSGSGAAGGSMNEEAMAQLLQSVKTLAEGQARLEQQLQQQEQDRKAAAAEAAKGRAIARAVELQREGLFAEGPEITAAVASALEQAGPAAEVLLQSLRKPAAPAAVLIAGKRQPAPKEPAPLELSEQEMIQMAQSGNLSFIS